YSHFCESYRRWRGGLDRVLRQEHKAGEKVFVDFAGQKVPIIDHATGEVLFEAEIFVGVLGASNFTYAQACRSQELPEWISAHTRMVEFFSGVPGAIVPDNLKSGVKRACYYEPDVNPTYQDWAQHYNTVVLPTRVRQPRDKAKVEAGVLVVERWILARLVPGAGRTLPQLRGSFRTARGARTHRARGPAPHAPAATGEAASARHARRHRLPSSTRARQERHPAPRFVCMDTDPRSGADQRRDGHGQELSRVCTRPQCLPPRALHALLPFLAHARRTRTRTRRWILSEAPGEAGA